MAERFARGGRLLARRALAAARSDARHVAVEFVHPVIVGKRALPAIGLAARAGRSTAQLALVAEPGDIVDGLRAPSGARGACAPRERGCLTVAFDGRPAPSGSSSRGGDDPFVRQELVETLYHVLWELVHVFFEHRGLLEGREGARTTPARRASSIRSWASARRPRRGARRRARVGADEGRRGGRAARADAAEGREALLAAAAALRARLDAGGRAARARQRRLGDRRDGRGRRPRAPAGPGWPAAPALDLTEDTAILTAVANDIGVEAIFARQVIAHGREGDVLLALSTSGNSANVLAALAEARRRGLATIALVGYDGGRIAAEGSPTTWS